MRYERHKDRQRERNIARAAPDKRQVLKFSIYSCVTSTVFNDVVNSCCNYENESDVVTLL